MQLARRSQQYCLPPGFAECAHAYFKTPKHSAVTIRSSYATIQILERFVCTIRCSNSSNAQPMFWAHSSAPKATAYSKGYFSAAMFSIKYETRRSVINRWSNQYHQTRAFFHYCSHNTSSKYLPVVFMQWNFLRLLVPL